MEAQPAGPGPIGTGELPEGYHLLGELARDGGLPVYLAEDLARGERVTLTDLGPLDDPNALTRLARAMDAVTGLAHPCIRPVRAVGAGDGHAYLVSPHIEDPDLGHRLAEWGPLPVAVALNVLGQVADALDAAHRVGVSHGGVRPGVIRFASETGRPYLTGFGVDAARPAVVDLASVEHQAPEQVIGVRAEPRTDVYALGGLLFRCLTGLAPLGGHDPSAVLSASLHVDPPRVSAYRADLPGALDQVVARAMAKDPTLRFDSCRAVVEAAAAAAGSAAPPRGRPRRTVRPRIVLALLIVVALVAGGAVAAPHVAAATWPTADDLARIPAALRADCDLVAADPRLPSAPRSLRCTEGGQDVVIGLFADDAAADAAYQGVVASNPDMRGGTGDCAQTIGSEHRYPGVGEFQGRVLCDRVGPAARLAWIDRSDRAVAFAERVDGNAIELYRSWARWVDLPVFPNAPEQQLLDVTSEGSCHRAPAGPLDVLDGVVAAVECVPESSGAGVVTYHRFADREALQRAYDADVARVGAPAGVYCPDAGRPGEDGYEFRGVPFGRVLCGTDGSTATVSWTNEPLLVMGRASGPDLGALGQWWKTFGGPARQPAIDALNGQLAPPFPTAEERQLMQQVPTASRVRCTRPATDALRDHVGTATVVGVTCGTTSGPDEAYYYRFTDAGALAAAAGSPDGPDCTAVPPGAFGSARYTRPDGSTGVLGCGTNDAGFAFVVWSDDQSSILGVAFDRDAGVLRQWWQSAAGPL
jgi:hypothetical protein